MTTKTNNLVIKFKGDTRELEGSFNKVLQVVQASNAGISKTITTVNSKTGQLSKTFKVTADSGKQLASVLNGIKATSIGDKVVSSTTALIGETQKRITAEKDLQRSIKERQQVSKEADKVALQGIQQTLAVEKAVITEGSNSIIAIKRKQTQEQLKLERQLQAELAANRRKFTGEEGNKSFLQQAKRRNELLEQFKRKSLELQKITNQRLASERSFIGLQEKLKTSQNAILAAQRKQSQQRIAAEKEVQRVIRERNSTALQSDNAALQKIRSRIAVEKSIVTAGANAIVTIKKQQALQEQQIFDELQRKLAANRRNFAQGQGTNNSFLQQASRRNKLLDDFKRKSIEIERISKQRISNQQRFLGLQNKLAASQKTILNNQRKFTNQIKRSTVATNSLTDAHRSLIRRIFDVVAGYRLVNSAINTAFASITNIPAAGIREQATAGALFGVFGLEQGTKNLENIKDTADKFGASLQSLEKGYRQFAPSAKLAGASQKEVNQIFEDITAATTVLRKTPEQLEFIFVALDQIFSKGTVQSEEIKRQLGNQLPAAVEIGAKAIGKTPRQFLEAMKRNEIVAKDFVPKFAALYRQIFAGEGEQVLATVAEQVFANYVRLLTKYELVNRAFFREFDPIINTVLKFLNNFVQGVLDNFGALIQTTKVLAVLLGTRLGISLVTVAAKMVQTAAAALLLNTALSRFNAGVVTSSAKTGIFGNAVKLTGGFLNKFSKILTGLPLVFTGAITGVGALTVSLLKLNGAQFSLSRSTKISSERLRELQETFTGADKDAADKAGRTLQRLAEFQGESSSFLINIRGETVGIFDFLSSFAGKILISLGKRVKNFTSTLGIAFTGFGDFIAKVFSISFTAISKAFSTLIDNFILKIKNFGSSVKKLFTGLGDLITTTISDFARPGINAIADVTPPKLKNTLKEFTEGLKTIKDRGTQAAEEISNNISDAITKVATFLEEGFVSGIDAASNRLDESSKKGQETFNKTVDDVLTEINTERNKAFDTFLTSFPDTDGVDLGFGSGLEKNSETLKKSTKNTNELSKATKELESHEQRLAAAFAVVNQRLAELNGDTALLARIKAEKDLLNEKATFEEALLRGNPAGARGLADRERIIDSIALEGELFAAQERRNELTNDFIVQSSILRAQVNASGKSELEGLLELTEQREQYINKLKENIVTAEALAKANGNISREAALGLKDAKNALRQLQEEGSPIVNEIAGTFSNAFTNAFTGFIAGTKSATQAIEDFGKSVLNTISRIATQQLATEIIGIIGSLAGGLTGTGASTGTISTTASTSIQGLATAVLGSEKGNVISQGNVIPFKRGGIPDVGTKQQFFPLANGGVGSIREGNKPEAILPLQRNSKGDLAVNAVGAGGGGVTIGSINVNVNSKEDASSEEQAQDIAKAVKAQMESLVQKRIAESIRPGNTLNPTQLQTTF